MFAWLQEHGGVGEGSEALAMNQTFWCAVTEILPKATLVDHGKVLMVLGLQPNPLTEDGQRRIEAVRRGSHVCSR